MKQQKSNNKTSMKTITTILSMKPTYYFILLLPLFHLIHSISANESPVSPEITTTLDDYIKKCCQLTLYQSLCYSSLISQYSGPPDLGNLTCTAIHVSLTEAKTVADYLASVNWTADPQQVGSAVQDCTRLTKASARQVHHSLDLMVKVVNAYVGAGGVYNETEKAKMRFDISSVQTWMSVGMTDQSTCMEGFEDVGVTDDDQVKSEVYEKVGVVIKLISNALALVNSYVDVFR